MLPKELRLLGFVGFVNSRPLGCTVDSAIVGIAAIVSVASASATAPASVTAFAPTTSASPPFWCRRHGVTLESL